MEGLNSLTSTLNQISGVARASLKNALDVMKEIDDADSEVVDELVDRDIGLNEETARTVLQDTSLQLIQDAEIVIGEIPNFASALTNGTISEDCPFLQEVWYGDAYGVTEIEALNELLTEMKAKLKTLTYDGIVEYAAQSLEVEA